MKRLIILGALLAGDTWAYQCNRSINSHKVVVFVDTNSSPAEVADAQKAACERGEGFKKIPKDSETIDAEKLEQELQALATRNIAVSSMVISGHDGGGSVHGGKGGVNKHEIINALKSAYKSKPDLLNEFKSVFMWGCWTMGPSEVDIWRKELPSLKMASGFIDMGPLNTTAASHAVLHDLLVKEKTILAEADQKKLKRMIAGVEHINLTYAAVYTEAACGDMYYYNTQGADGDSERSADNLNYTPGNHFLDFNKNFDCKGAAADIEKNRKELIKYFYGELPLPPSNSQSPILRIYSFIRSHANCLKENHILNGDRIGMLRFYEGVKENFAYKFGDISKDALAEFKTLNAFTQKYTPKGKMMQDFEKYFDANKGNFFSTDAATLKTKSRKDIMKMISFLDGVTKQPMAKDPAFSKNVKNMKRLKNAMEIYLFQLSPKCMNFLDWHEHVPGYAPSAMCKV
jgi:hypothetical protein